jgi:mono/diheme cytochrome c family protein
VRGLASILVLGVGMAWASRQGSLLQQVPARASEQANPYAASDEATRAGAKLYSRQCAACHGRDARGMGKAPALISPFVREASPGALFWLLRNGAVFHGMPSFAHLPDQQRWQIVTYLKSL